MIKHFHPDFWLQGGLWKCYSDYSLSHLLFEMVLQEFFQQEAGKDQFW